MKDLNESGVEYEMIARPIDTQDLAARFAITAQYTVWLHRQGALVSDLYPPFKLGGVWVWAPDTRRR